MRRRHEGQPCTLRKLRRNQPILIDWYGVQSSSGGQKRIPCSLIIRILDDRDISSLQQHACSQVECLLRSINDDHLRRFADDRARSSQMFRDRLA